MLFLQICRFILSLYDADGQPICYEDDRDGDAIAW